MEYWHGGRCVATEFGPVWQTFKWDKRSYISFASISQFEAINHLFADLGDRQWRKWATTLRFGTSLSWGRTRSRRRCSSWARWRNTTWRKSPPCSALEQVLMQRKVSVQIRITHHLYFRSLITPPPPMTLCQNTLSRKTRLCSAEEQVLTQAWIFRTKMHNPLLYTPRHRPLTWLQIRNPPSP